MTDTKELPKRTRYYQSMIDLQLIDKGELYNKLNPSYVIFISPFDTFGQGRHIYTFENLWREDNSIVLNDGTVKIFLNASGKMDDISKELSAFLDYVAGKESDDAFVRKLEEAVKQARKNREWRHEYMTLWMRDQENIEKGREEGKIYGAVSTYRELGLSDSEILERLQKKYHITESEAEAYMQETVS